MSAEFETDFEIIQETADFEIVQEVASQEDPKTRRPPHAVDEDRSDAEETDPADPTDNLAQNPAQGPDPNLRENEREEGDTFVRMLSPLLASI